MTTPDWPALDARYIWHPFTQEQTAPPPIPIVSAQGATLTTVTGSTILDLVSSWWVTTHGHGHPVIAQAIAQQAQRLEQVMFAGFTHQPAAQLAAQLIQLLPPPLSRVFYSDNGSTSVEVALKMACQYWLNQGQTRTRFLTFQGGYHGDTVGAMSAGQSSGFFGAFQNLLFQVDTLPYPETWDGDEEVVTKENAALHALDVYLEQFGTHCAAMIAEPLLQGAAGMRLCRPVFLQRLSERLRSADVLLIFDEVMTGFGRTGAMFACLKAGVTPDLICLSKGLSGGFLPLAATVCREEIRQAFLGESFSTAFAHGHSFTANPLGCAAGLASLQLFESEHTLTHIATLEAIHRDRLQRLGAGHPKVVRTRVLGSIAAFDLTVPDQGYGAAIAPLLKARFLEQGLLIRPLGHVIYLLPPYCLTPAQLHHAWDVIDATLHQMI